VPGPPPGPGPPTIARLVREVEGLRLHHGIKHSLLAKLRTVQRKLDAGQIKASCGSLRAYLNEVHAQSHPRLDAKEAAQLISEAKTIRGFLGCAAK
jgi:hypothetical protein